MASSGKKKTTMAKLNRESRLRERRVEKKARKEARKLAAIEGPVDPGDTFAEMTDESAEPDAERQPTLETVGQTHSDA